MKKTKRLIIRPLELKDYKQWVLYYTNMDKKKNLWDIEPKDPSQLTKSIFKEALKSQKKLRDLDQFYDYVVFEKRSGDMIGQVSAMDISRGLAQTCYLGYRIHNQYWGHGYGKEATLGLISICFENLKLHRVEAGIEPYNRRSILLARKIGLRKEGTKKRAVFLKNEWVDLVMYSATCEEFGHKWKGTSKPRLR